MALRREPGVQVPSDAVPAAALFSFEEAEGSARGEVRICGVEPIAPVCPEEVLDLAARVRWPGHPPIARAVAAALADRGMTPPAEPDGDGTPLARWHPIPYQGIDGQVGPFDILVGTADFLEDAGFVLGDSVRDLLSRHAGRGLWSVLIGASRRGPGAPAGHRSLIGVLAVEPNPGDLASGDAADRRRAGSLPPAARAAPTAPPQRRRIHLGTLKRIIRSIAPLTAAAVASALAGLWFSCLAVPADELAVVQRFGRVVARAGPGVHVRPLWLLERVTRVRPAAVRTAGVGLPVPAPGAEEGPIGDLMPTGDIWPPSATGGPAASAAAGTEPPRSVSGLLCVRARVQYGIADPEAFLFEVRDTEAAVAELAEAVLRALIAHRSLDACLTRQRGELAADAARLLQERLDAIGAGLTVDAVFIDGIEPIAGTGDAPADPIQIGLLEAGLQQQAAADRFVADARRQAMTLLAEVQRDGERQVGSAQRLLERVRAADASFRRDPQGERRRLEADRAGGAPEGPGCSGAALPEPAGPHVHKELKGGSLP